MTAKERLGGEAWCDCVVDVMVRALLKDEGPANVGAFILLSNPSAPRALTGRPSIGLVV
jgi:hypothetical protein